MPSAVFSYRRLSMVAGRHSVKFERLKLCTAPYCSVSSVHSFRRSVNGKRCMEMSGEVSKIVLHYSVKCTR